MSERSLIRRAGLFVLAALLPAAATAQSTRTPYLEAAEDLGRWLQRTTNEGRTWPSTIDNDGTTVRTSSVIGLGEGAAGLGLFFAALHGHTRDAKHLSMAVAAAEFERTYHVRGVFNGPDYLAGAAGSGLFLLAMHEQTGDARYLAWARDAATWLEQTARRPAPDQAWWWHFENHPNRYTGIPHGATGIALFQLELYRRTDDAAYLADAEDAYRWVRTHALPIGGSGAIGFKRLAADSDVYNWWSGGSAGVMLLLGQLYGATGKAEYLDDLRRTADGLVALAKSATPWGVNWTYGATRESGRPPVFGHGNGSIAPSLLLAHEYIGDPLYLSTANDSIAWLVASAKDGAARGVAGRYWEGGNMPSVVPAGALVGASSVGWAFARMFPLTRDAQLRTFALASADYMLATSEMPAPGQRRWINYPGAENLAWDPQTYDLGWYYGNTGIGLFLLAAHELAVGSRPGLEVHAP